MNSHTKTAVIVGVLFIIATVAASIGYEIILGPILNSQEYLINISENENKVLIGMLLALTNSAAIVCIPVVLFPILKKHNEALAVGYLGARILECATFIVGVISLLVLLTLSQEFVQAGASDASYFQTLGTLLLAAYDWTFWLAVTLVLGLTAMILNYTLYQARLVPRFISAWGFIGGTLVFAQGLLEIFGFSRAILSLPIASQEMVLAVWLIVKGFNLSAIASESA